jgi:hypothetical protein
MLSSFQALLGAVLAPPQRAHTGSQQQHTPLQCANNSKRKGSNRAGPKCQKWGKAFQGCNNNKCVLCNIDATRFMLLQRINLSHDNTDHC